MGFMKGRQEETWDPDIFSPFPSFYPGLLHGVGKTGWVTQSGLCHLSKGGGET